MNSVPRIEVLFLYLGINRWPVDPPTCHRGAVMGGRWEGAPSRYRCCWVGMGERGGRIEGGYCGDECDGVCLCLRMRDVMDRGRGFGSGRRWTFVHGRVGQRKY